ncbi:MAG: hypothetical protein K6C10_01235 [Prevotella sp.]|nr:hypothetical protein [Prevotella sp.]
MVYYLTHFNRQTYPFLIDYLNKNGVDACWIHPPVKHGEYLNALLGAWAAVKKASKGDTIITYMSSAGVLCWWISFLLFKRIHVIATNLALKDDSSLQTRMMEMLYRGALKSKRFTLTVTSQRYGETMRKKLHSKKELPLLRDYNHFPNYANDYVDKGKRVFCGGSSQRDWMSCVRLAKEMPDWRFLLVGWRNEEEVELPANIKRFDRLPFKQFIQAMRESTFVYVPVLWNCPAGLIVMMEAAWEGKLIATSENDITVEYVSDEHGIADNDIESIAKRMIDLYLHPEECKDKVRAMQQFLSRQCSAEAYSKTLAELVKRNPCIEN